MASKSTKAFRTNDAVKMKPQHKRLQVLETPNHGPRTKQQKVTPPENDTMFTPLKIPRRNDHGATKTMGNEQMQQQKGELLLLSPLELQASRPPAHGAAQNEIKARVNAIRKKLKVEIHAHKKAAMERLEQQYEEIKHKVEAEIEEAETQLAQIHKINESIHEKIQSKMQSIAEMASAEVEKLNKARSQALATTAQLYSKEKHKIVQKFVTEIDALT